MSTARITDDNLGAWLIKCQPTVNVEVPRAILSGDRTPITRWCVATNYRSRMMKAGDRVLLWVSGDGRRLARGIWGAGHVTWPVRRMLDEQGCQLEKLEVPLSVLLLLDGLPAEEIRSAGIALEVWRSPMGSNPSWIEIDQLAALDELLAQRS